MNELTTGDDHTFTLEQYRRATDAPEKEVRAYVSVEVLPAGERWQDSAACIPHDGNWWFPRATAEGQVQGRAARAICRACPVRVECIEHACRTENLGHCGIRGGFSEPDLRRLRAALRRGQSITLGMLARLEATCVRCGELFVKVRLNQRTCGGACPGPPKVEPAPRYVAELPGHISHGTRWAYENYKCRCDPCRTNASAIRRRKVERRSERAS